MQKNFPGSPGTKYPSEKFPKAYNSRQHNHTMSNVMTQSSKKYGQETQGLIEDQRKQHMKVTLYSTDLKSIEKVCSSFIENCKARNLTVRGPARMPVKKLKITTRKSPCGEGSKTWDKFELRIYKRLISVRGPADLKRQISQFTTYDAAVDIEVELENN